MTNQFLLGVVASLSIVTAIFFLRFWRQTHDRLFLIFALSFGVEGVNRIALASDPHPSEASPVFYLIRLAAFVLIVIGILDKNRAAQHK